MLETLAKGRSADACGDLLGHYLTPDGTVADPDLESRTVGFRLDDLRGAAQAIAVASGADKAPVIRAALTSRLCSVLITHEAAARAPLQLRLRHCIPHQQRSQGRRRRTDRPHPARTRGARRERGQAGSHQGQGATEAH